MLAGACLTGVACFLATVLLGWVPELARASLAAAIAVGAVLTQLGFVRLPFPQTARQVPTSVFDLGPRLGAFAFGVDMGTGVRTYLPALGAHVLAAGLVLLGVSLEGIMAAALGFGTGRAAMPLLRYLSLPDELSWDRQLARRLRWLSPLSTALVGAWVVVLSTEAALG